jgi:hypothetical protein
MAEEKSAENFVRHLPAKAVDELQRFFEATDALEDKKLELLGWRGADSRDQNYQATVSVGIR